MSRRKQSNPKPLKPGEDSEWNATEENADGAAKKCDVTTAAQATTTTATSATTTPMEQQQQQPEPSPPSTSAAAEPEDPTPATTVATEQPKLRLNPNLATDPARCSPDNEPSPPPMPSTVARAAAAAAACSSSSSSSSSSAAESNHNVLAIAAAAAAAATAPRAIQVFVCNPCGIRFSSLSTLDAHQTYYCSRRQKKNSESDDVKISMGIESDEMILGNDTDSRPSSVEPSTKSVKTGKQYKCPHCSYSADKKVSLNRHMRMHSISPVSVQSPPCPPDTADPSAVDRYCQNCDIRFSNLRTYQAHKTHYCNTRHVVKPTPSSSPMMATAGNPSPPASVAVPTYLALPTNPVIVVPYSLVQNASVLSALSVDIGPSPPNDTACIVLSDGTLQPIAQALVPTKYNVIGGGLVNNNNNNNNNNDNVMQQADNSQTPPAEFFSLPKKTEFVNQPETTVVAAKKTIVHHRPSSPLDLRLKREAKCSPDDGEEEKENRRSDGNVTDAEDIVCAPSIPCMIMSPSCSPPSAGSRTPQRSVVVTQQQQQLQQQQPVNGVIRKHVAYQQNDASAAAVTYDSAPDKLSVSSLLHAATAIAASNNRFRETAIQQESAAAAIAAANNEAAILQHRYNPIHKSRIVSASLPHAATVHHRNQAPVVDHHQPPIGPVSVLPYLTSEMTLRLAAGVQEGHPPGAAHHQFFLKQGPSKCESCNIVFCKYENFLAHKKHYCASRPPPPQLVQNDGDEGATDCKTSPEGSPGPKPLTVGSPQSSKDSVSPTPAALKPPMIQFICSTCGVKFSSFDNLTTHQSYYCPNRMTVPIDPDKSLLHPAAAATAVSVSQTSKCPKCKMTIEPGNHAQHQCQASCWKCPVCGAVCTSASAAQKHLDNHNGIRAFVCTICQYKGNTLRGLRTHIRMHFNKRLIPDLTEEDYVSCVIDESSSTSADGGPPTTAKGSDGRKSEAMKIVPAAAVPVDRSPGDADDDNDGADGPEEDAHEVVIKQEPNGGGAGASSDGGEHESSATEDQQQPHSTDDGGVGGEAMTAKYCKVCDISFNYLSTFIAHKKYYCRNSTEIQACNAENAKTATVTS